MKTCSISWWCHTYTFHNTKSLKCEKNRNSIICICLNFRFTADVILHGIIVHGIICIYKLSRGDWTPSALLLHFSGCTNGHVCWMIGCPNLLAVEKKNYLFITGGCLCMAVSKKTRDRRVLQIRDKSVYSLSFNASEQVCKMCTRVEFRHGICLYHLVVVLHVIIFSLWITLNCLILPMKLCNIKTMYKTMPWKIILGTIFSNIIQIIRVQNFFL